MPSKERKEKELISKIKQNLDYIEKDEFVPATEQKCPICMSKNRVKIEELIVIGMPYEKIIDYVAETFNEKITKKQIERHVEKHFPFEKLSILKFLERERKKKELLEDAVDYTVSYLDYLTALQQIAFKNLLEHPHKVLPKDGIAAAQALHNILEGNKILVEHEIIVNEFKTQVETLMSVVSEILTPEQKQLLLIKLQQLKETK